MYGLKRIRISVDVIFKSDPSMSMCHNSHWHFPVSAWLKKHLFFPHWLLQVVQWTY